MKKIILPLFAILLLAACEKESTSEIIPEVNNYENGTATTRSNKRDVCHNGNIININVNAIPAHQAHGDAVDMDEDGYFDIDNPCSETDCDDTDANVNPGVVEITYNGMDDDCDPLTPDDDLDGDGYNQDVDCNDDDANINPGAEEICENGIDDNCDDQIDEDCIVLQLGDSHAGGIIFYLDESGQHGLVAATTYQTPDGDLTKAWGCHGTLLGITGEGIGDGQANTTAWINECGQNSKAARSCYDYSVTVDGILYDDWFLPSKGELNLMYTNLYLQGLGGFLSLPHWSSTEYSLNDAWGHRFDNGNQWAPFKGYGGSLTRAARAF